MCMLNKIIDNDLFRADSGFLISCFFIFISKYIDNKYKIHLTLE